MRCNPLAAGAIATIAIYPVHFQMRSQALHAEISPQIDALSPNSATPALPNARQGWALQHRHPDSSASVHHRPGEGGS